LNANRQSDNFTSLEIAPGNSNHIPGGTMPGGECCLHDATLLAIADEVIE
jgi:hypothetical protein